VRCGFQAASGTFALKENSSATCLLGKHPKMVCGRMKDGQICKLI
jgi:hypothetical protein